MCVFDWKLYWDESEQLRAFIYRSNRMGNRIRDRHIPIRHSRDPIRNRTTISWRLPCRRSTLRRTTSYLRQQLKFWSKRPVSRSNECQWFWFRTQWISHRSIGLDLWRRHRLWSCDSHRSRYLTNAGITSIGPALPWRWSIRARIRGRILCRYVHLWIRRWLGTLGRQWVLCSQ